LRRGGEEVWGWGGTPRTLKERRQGQENETRNTLWEEVLEEKKPVRESRRRNADACAVPRIKEKGESQGKGLNMERKSGIEGMMKKKRRGKTNWRKE